MNCICRAPSDSRGAGEVDIRTARSRKEQQVKSQIQSPSALGKRRRIVEEDTPGQNRDGTSREKRPRGRPKNQQRGAEVLTKSTRRSRAFFKGNGRPSDRYSLAETRGRRHRDQISQNSDAIERRTSPSLPSSQGFLENIFDLLMSIGDRKWQDEELKSRTAKSETATVDPAAGGAQRQAPSKNLAHSTAETSQNIGRSNRSDSPLSSSRSSVLNSSTTKQSRQSRRIIHTSKSQFREARFHAMKGRGPSSLRHVINAEPELVVGISHAPTPADRLWSSKTARKEPTESEATGSMGPTSSSV